VKDREKQIQDWRAKAEASIKAGNLLPPDKENAFDAIRSIQRLDKDNSYVRGAISQLKELLQNRGDAKITASDWRGARNDFRLILQYFPEDSYSKTRLTAVDAKIAELAQLEQQRAAEELQSRQKISALRQSAPSGRNISKPNPTAMKPISISGQAIKIRNNWIPLYSISKNAFP
jgi:hypothetical protein